MKYSRTDIEAAFEAGASCQRWLHEHEGDNIRTTKRHFRYWIKSYNKVINTTKRKREHPAKKLHLSNTKQK